MANVEDFIFDSDGDIKIFNGDLAVEPSDNQHIQDIFLANKGQFRQFPTIGIGIESKLCRISQVFGCRAPPGILRDHGDGVF